MILTTAAKLALLSPAPFGASLAASEPESPPAAAPFSLISAADGRALSVTGWRLRRRSRPTAGPTWLNGPVMRSTAQSSSRR